MSMVGQGRSVGIFIFVPKIREPLVTRSIFLFSSSNSKSKTDDPVIISSWTVTPETKRQKRHLTHFAPPFSFCPILL